MITNKISVNSVIGFISSPFLINIFISNHADYTNIFMTKKNNDLSLVVMVSKDF